MANISPLWEAEWTDSTLNAASVTSGTDGDFVDLTGHDLCEVYIYADNQAVTPTDDLIIEVYTSTDGGSTYSITPMAEFALAKSPDPNSIHLLIRDVAGFRLKVKNEGTDTIEVTAKYRRRKWTSS